MESLKIDRSKLITQAKYAELKSISRARVNQMINEGKLNTVNITGGILIYLD